MIELPDHVIPACMAEGGAETAILNILLDNGLLIFSRDDLYQNMVIPRMKGEEFAQRYLRFALSKPLYLFRVIDSSTENFRLPKAYQPKVKDHRILTRPEIEMLVIISEGRYAEYEKYHNSKNPPNNKPSDFCIEILKLKKVKKPDFIHDYFADSEQLLQTIRDYHRLHKPEKGAYSLFDLLK